MMVYAHPASCGGGARSVAAFRARDWGVYFVPGGRGRGSAARLPYILDCRSRLDGAPPFDPRAYRSALRRRAAGADFVVLPDIPTVREPGDLFGAFSWLGAVSALCPRVMVAVDARAPLFSDGRSLRRVRAAFGPRCGFYVVAGGERFEALLRLGAIARDIVAPVHVAGVDTVEAMQICVAAGVDSASRSEVARHASPLADLDAVRRQPDLLAGLQ